MSWPEKSNELVEYKAHELAIALQEQFGGEIVGHFHIFMRQGKLAGIEGGEEVTSNTIILHYVPEDADTDHNMLHIASDFLDWAIKRETP